jgi:putative MATE family efflux protein
VPRTLWFLAWPQYAESAFQIVDQIADLVFAGLFGGFRAIAGIGASQQYVMIGFTLRQGVDVAMRAMVSRAIGMGDAALANHVVLQAFSISLVYSVLLAAVGILFTEPLLRVLGLSEAVIEVAADYMRIQFVGQASVAFEMLASNSLQAAGDSLTPMKAGFIARGSKIALTPVLIFGVLGLPGFGLAGAALATIAGHVFALAYLLAVLMRGTSRLHLDFRGYRTDWDLQKRMLKIGWPASINRMERNIGVFLFGVFVAPFGDVAYAAFTVTRRVEMFAHMGATGVGNAAGTIVGQSIGAGKPERARQAMIWACAFGGLINGAIALVMAFFPDLFLSMFAREPEFLAAARIWLYIMLAGYVGLGVSGAMVMAFQQAGSPMIVMLVNMGTMWATVPLAFVLTHFTPVGALGVAWAMLATLLIRPVAYIPYFLNGSWLKVRLFAHERIPSSHA